MLGGRLNEKTGEVMEMKKKYNGVLEAKVRLEEELAGVRFTLDNLRQQAHLELKEKAIKIENVERTFHDALVAKNEEIRHMNDKLRSAEEEVRKLRENNTLLLTRGDLSQAPKLDNVSRIYPNDSNMKSLANKSAGKENFQGYGNNRGYGMDGGRLDTKFDAAGGNQRLNDILTEKDKLLEEKDSEII